jgi:fibronectin-binding autotransporter adhesin
MKTVNASHHANPASATRVQRRTSVVLLIIIVALIVRGSAHAASVSWTDATNKWESNNWTGGVGTNPPTAADTAIIGNGGVVNFDGLTGTRTVSALQVGNPNINNGTLNISGGSLTVTNNVTISGGGSTDGTITITGTGALNVGGIVVDGGNGTSTVTLNGGTLDLASDATPGSIAANTFNAQSGTLKNVSQIFQGDNTTVAALTKTTTGTLTLNTANTYTGGTSVMAGTLLVNGGTVGVSSGTGTGNVTVNNGGTLGGTGNISGGVSVTNGSTLNPGPSGTSGTAASVGTLNTGALTMSGTSTFHIDAAGTLATDWDKLNVTGAVALGTQATLQLSIASGLNFASGAQYMIIANDAADLISGTFSNAANGSTVALGGYNFTVNYNGGTGNDLVLTAVPEPSTWVAAALSLVAVAYSGRRKLVPALKRYSAAD